jgi:hypothetical protein
MTGEGEVDASLTYMYYLVFMKKIFFSIFSLLLFSCASQNIQTFKGSDAKLASGKQSFIYALPQTSISVTLEITRTTIRKGPYAEFAQKYLNLSNVPLTDLQTWTVSDVKLNSRVEADPAQIYSITFRAFPDKLNSFFSLSGNGIILDLANASKMSQGKALDAAISSSAIFDPHLINETNKEKVDTFYKTVMTDSSFVRIPIFKKQIEAKTEEDLAKEVAHELIKTRKRRLKILRGEYEFHPDGAALKVMINELNNYEEQLRQMFAGISQTEKSYYTYTIVPQSDNLVKELAFIHPSKGLQDSKTPGSAVISIQVNKEQEAVKSLSPDKAQNILYIRAPIMASIMVKRDDKNLLTSRIPVYQFGPVQTMPLK